MAIKSTPRQHYVKVKIEKEIEKLAPIIATTAITVNHNAYDSLNSRRVAFLNNLKRGKILRQSLRVVILTVTVKLGKCTQPAQ